MLLPALGSVKFRVEERGRLWSSERVSAATREHERFDRLVPLASCFLLLSHAATSRSSCPVNYA